jgi:hypothetical protein
MIKALMSGDTENRLLLVGMTLHDIEVIMSGSPAMIDGDRYDLPNLKIAICYGIDHAAICKDIKDNLGIDVTDQLNREPGPGEEIIIERVQTDQASTE